jgi:uncharacterized Zn finger protein
MSQMVPYAAYREMEIRAEKAEAEQKVLADHLRARLDVYDAVVTERRLLRTVVEAAEPFLDHACTCDVLVDQACICAVCLLRERFAALAPVEPK